MPKNITCSNCLHRREEYRKTIFLEDAVYSCEAKSITLSRSEIFKPRNCSSYELRIKPLWLKIIDKAIEILKPISVIVSSIFSRGNKVK